MANYSAIKSAVNAYIKRNGKKEITGSILNAILNSVIDSLGRYFQFAGGALPTDDPGTPDQNVCYLASIPGNYTHLGGFDIGQGEIAVIKFDGEWHKETIFDLSADVNTDDLSVPIGGKLQIADRKPGVNTNGMGYVILRQDKTIAEQVTQSDTIYEVRYDFDLDGGVISLPSNVGFVFNGGKITNGDMTSSDNTLRVENIPQDTLNDGVFSRGFNISGESVRAEDIGLIPRNAGKASVNDAILGVVFSLRKNLVLNDHYHISSSFDIDYDLEITGNGKIDRGGLSNIFIPKAGCSISISGITFSSGYVIRSQSLTYDIGKIHIRDCSFTGRTRLMDIRNASGTNHSISEIIVEGCNFNIDVSGIMLPSGVVVDRFIVKNNTIDNFINTFLWYANVDDNATRHGEVVMEGNIVTKPIICDNSDYFTLALVSCDKFIYQSNVIRGLIGIGQGVTYEAYASCREYYCSDNFFENICQMPVSGSLNTTLSEIFKSKGGGGIRYANGNVWTIDFGKVRTILEDNEITFTDEQFETINVLNFFGFTSVVDVEFSNNRINIMDGGLIGMQSSSPIRNLLFRNNQISVGKESTYPCFQMSRGDSVISDFTFEGNTFSGNKNWFNTGTPTAYSSTDGRFVIRNNTFDRMFHLPYAEKGEIKNNLLSAFSGDASGFRNRCKIAGCEAHYQDDSGTATSPINLSTIVESMEVHLHMKTGETFISVSDGLFVSVDGYTFEIDKTNRVVKDIYGNVLKSSISTQYWNPSTIVTTANYNVRLSVGSTIYLVLSPAAGLSEIDTIINFYTNNPINLNGSKRVASYDNEKKIAVFYDGNSWKDSDGFTPAPKSGDTSSRPVLDANDAGFQYFDTDLVKVIVWSGADWINVDGSALS